MPQQDENEQTPLCRAFERFSRELNPKEKESFSSATLRDVLVNVRELDGAHASSSTTRSLARRIDPFLRFLDRHAKALDSMVQVYPNPSALIWGVVRVILEVNSCDLAAQRT